MDQKSNNAEAERAELFRMMCQMEMSKARYLRDAIRSISAANEPEPGAVTNVPHKDNGDADP